jgi:hypothetical protein
MYSSPHNIWVIKQKCTKCGGNVVRVEEERGAHRILVGKPEEKVPLARSRDRCVDNITKNFQEIRWSRYLSYLV